MSILSISISSLSRNFFLFLCIIYIPCSQVNAQVIWDKTYGGTYDDYGEVIIPAVDGDGFLIGGVSGSESGNHKSASHYGGADYWIVRVDDQGNRLWDKSYSGLNGDDRLECIIPTSDGGYLLGGESNSLMGNHKSENALFKNLSDVWIIKIDAQGNKLWDKTLGGSSNDGVAGMVQTSDGGFILAATSMAETYDFDFENDSLLFDKSELGRGVSDFWLIRIDSNGNKLWDKLYGSNYFEGLSSFIPTKDGNYLLVGSSSSDAGYEKSEKNIAGTTGNVFAPLDYWVLKIDPQGNKIWDNTIGGFDDDAPYDVFSTSDGGFLIGGYSYSEYGADKSENNTPSPSLNNADYWLVKIDSNGTKIWDRTYGGSNQDFMHDIVVSSNGFIYMLGWSVSDMGHDKTLNTKGGNNEIDIWIVKTYPQGNILGDMSLGGSTKDYAENAILIGEDSLLIIARSDSPISYDKTSPNLGNGDYWLLNVKFKADINYDSWLISIDDWILTCRFCDIWGHPWEDIIDIEYRFWRTELGVEAATSRLAYSGSRTHRDVVYWENDTDLAIAFYPDLAAGEYQFRMRGKLSNRSYNEWTEPTTFEIEGSRVEAFPNPVRNRLHVVYQASRAEEVQVTIMDQMGQVLLSESHYAIEGANEWSLDLGRLGSELLTLEITNDYHEPYTKRLLRE